MDHRFFMRKSSAAFQHPGLLIGETCYLQTNSSTCGFPQTRLSQGRRIRSVLRKTRARSFQPRCSTAETPVWETLTVSEFDHRLKSGTLSLCLIGMSNCGKSFWSKQLHNNLRFQIVCIDDLIEERLAQQLAVAGHVGIDGLAAWMGFPSDDFFASRQAEYLSAEERITAAAAAMLHKSGSNSVLDTTGSVVYLSNDTRDLLSSNYLVVHLEASDDLLAAMTDNYFLTPKPVVWGDSFNQRDGESPESALRRCYPALLRERRERYAKMAHVTVPAATSLSEQLNVHGFIDEVRSRLRITA